MNAITTILRLLIQTYRVTISPFIGPRCRYLPTCSEYTAEALRIHGAAYGSWLGLCRIARCHPWGQHGYDPVPLKPNTSDIKARR